MKLTPKEFYEQYKIDRGLNYLEGLKDVFDIMEAYYNHDKMGKNLDLKELERKLDEALENETKETFDNWLDNIIIKNKQL